ncbi:hypothetical protein PGQ11_011379 [Apiospora arundinis]|uniref:Uncharacterized protein n=1 Tax=Apiospora arundinis TaxID=335852 RepID=A0ABR2I0A3_9PEZI
MLSLTLYPLCSGKQFQSMKLLQLPEKGDAENTSWRLRNACCDRHKKRLVKIQAHVSRRRSAAECDSTDDLGDKEIDGYEAMGRELETKKEVADGSDPVDSYALTGNAFVTLTSARGFRNHNLSVNPSGLEQQPGQQILNEPYPT